LNASAARDFPGFWAKLARMRCWEEAIHRRSTNPMRVLQVVRGRRAQCVLQLP
jgi:hypothetical protein